MIKPIYKCLRSPENILKEYATDVFEYPYICCLIDDIGLVAMFVDEEYVNTENGGTIYFIMNKRWVEISEYDLLSDMSDKSIIKVLHQILGLKEYVPSLN